MADLDLPAILAEYDAFRAEFAEEMGIAQEWLRGWVVANLLILERETTDALVLLLASGTEWALEPLTTEG